MVNDLIDGHIYFLESDAVRNQNWVPTVANISLASNFTEGDDYIEMILPKQWIKAMWTGIKIEDASGGNSFMTRTSRKGYMLTIIALEVPGSAVDLIEQFFMSNTHTASSPSTFKQYHCIIRRSVTEYVKFTDSNDIRQDYLRGADPTQGGIEVNRKTGIPITTWTVRLQ